MDFRIIEKRDDGTTIAILGDEPLTIENDQARPSNRNENRSPRRTLHRFPIFNHPFLLRNSLELNSSNVNEHRRIERSNDQQTPRSSDNHQSNQTTRTISSHQSNQITRTSNSQQSNQATRTSNNQQSNQTTRTSNNQQSNQAIRTSNIQFIHRPDSVQPSPFSRNDDSNFIENGIFGGQLLQMEDFLDDNEINRRYPNDDNSQQSSYYQPPMRWSRHIDDALRPSFIPLSRRFYPFRSNAFGLSQFSNDQQSNYTARDLYNQPNTSFRPYRYGRHNLQMDHRFPADDNHYFHYRPRNASTNGMSHHIVDQSDLKNDLNCTICLSNFKSGEKTYKLRCGHIFHEDCLVPWRENHNSCPTCRQRIDINEPPDSSQACVIC